MTTDTKAPTPTPPAAASRAAAAEEECPASQDGHCDCWWDGEGCCRCGAPPMTDAEWTEANGDTPRYGEAIPPATPPAMARTAEWSDGHCVRTVGTCDAIYPGYGEGEGCRRCEHFSAKESQSNDKK